MKQIFFLILLCLGFYIKSYAGVADVPLHLRCSSYPLCASKVYAVNYYYGYLYGRGEHRDDISCPKDYFDLFVTEEDYASQIDFNMIVAFGYSSSYLVRVIPTDDGYSFVGLSRAKYTGEFWEWRKYATTDSYVLAEFDNSDFVFDPENLDDEHITNCGDYLHREDHKYIFKISSPVWIGGCVSDLYMQYNKERTSFEFVGDPNCFPENPNEYLYAVFARVVISNFKEKEVFLYPRANEIGDEVTLTCTRDDFDYWIEEGTGRHIAENPYTFTVTGKETYTAHFVNQTKIAPLQLPSGKEGSSLTAHPSSDYDLQGRKVNVNDKKGIYIKGGQKRVIR